MSQPDTYIDVVELCGLLQCLGFHVKSFDAHDGNSSTDGTRTVVVDCLASGLHVVLETGNLTCSCPTVASQQNSGVWQVSGITGGKQLDKEFGSTIIGSLPKIQRERLTQELLEIVRSIKEYNESDMDKQKEGVTNRSVSMIEMKTPEKRHTPALKVETPTRYRSLDTLTAAKKEPESIPAPGLLQKQTAHESVENIKKEMCPRQSTYTLASTPDSDRSARRNKTSSPIQRNPSIHLSNVVIEGLIAAEKAAEELRGNLSFVIKELMEDGKYDSSSSLALDVSKILKVPENSRIQFASSPNLSRMGIQGTESASTSNLMTKSSIKDDKVSRLQKLSSPNIYQLRKTASASKVDKDNKDKKTSKFNSLFKPKIATPVRVNSSKSNSDASPNISGTKKKFSNIKSTIPRPSSKKE